MNNSKILEEIQRTNKNRIQNLSVENENSSLYIGDLSSKVTENDILYIFSKMSGLLYVKICRDVFSKKSLGYGYINFESTKYAKKALKKMNKSEFFRISIFIKTYFTRKNFTKRHTKLV